jgi:Domain of unknown function (DUF1990)
VPTAPLTALRWPVGVLVTGWSYLWRTTPMHRRELPGDWDRDAPPALPAALPQAGIQPPDHGAGALLHRRYRVRVKCPRMDAAELIAHVSADPNRVAPSALAHFRKTRGADGRMAVGDEWVVRMPGPWDGPVRVVELGPGHFRFATLDGHLEAGQIEWRAEADGDALVFGITSWARPGDRVSDLLHNRLRMAKEVQLHMWTSVLERVARLAGDGHDGGLDIETRVVAADALPEAMVRA